MTVRSLLFALLVLVTACSPAREDSIDPEGRSDPQGKIDREGKTFSAVEAEETVTLTGTEPFWNLRIAKGEGLWTTPENQEGTRFALARFAGNGGLGFTGTLDGRSFTATLTPGECSDGMSDFSYPFTATIKMGDETLQGCGETDSKPATGPQKP
jgi:uncharacterized membrane protein